MQTGNLVSIPNGGGLGTVLSSRTLVADESGRKLNLYRIRPISGDSKAENPNNADSRPPFSSIAGLQAPEGLDKSAGKRLVASETLTALQAQALDSSPQNRQHGHKEAIGTPEADKKAGIGKNMSAEEVAAQDQQQERKKPMIKRIKRKKASECQDWPRQTANPRTARPNRPAESH